MRRSPSPFPRAFVHILFLICGCSAALPRRGPATDGDCNGLRGTWEGALPIDARSDDSVVHDEVILRLALTGDQPKVYLKERGTWMEVKPGAFAVRCLGPSAVVHAIDSGRDSDGTWVESWVLAVTVRDPKDLLARWIRMVNNVDLPLTNRSSKFGYQGAGILRRVEESADALECREEKRPDDSTTIGEFLQWSCDCGNAGSCGILATLLEREGDSASLARAKALRQKACQLGHQQFCATGQ